MAVLVLSSAGRRALEAIVAPPRDGRQYRRAQTLLWLAEGERPQRWLGGGECIERP